MKRIKFRSLLSAVYARTIPLIERHRLAERFPDAVRYVQQRLDMLEGEKAERTAWITFVIDTCLGMVAIAAMSLLLSLLTGGNWAVFVLGIGFSGIFPVYKIKQLDKKLVYRKKQIVLELPNMLTKITLLINAGETLTGALQKCVAACENKTGNPLMEQLEQVVRQIKNNEPLSRAMEQFSKRCGVQEVSVFTTTVLLNHRRGGDELVLTLRNLTRELWEKRKTTIRTMGEEASSKLVFPMVCMFLVIMLIIGAPAVMMMNI